MAAEAKVTPWYKLKQPRTKYLVHGDPEPLTYEDVTRLQNWRGVEKEKLEMWQDSKRMVLDKNKKREYVVEHKEPEQRANGNYGMSIKILHLDRRGFIYNDEAEDPESLQRNFWPVVELLIAIYFSPKLKIPPLPVLPNTRNLTEEEMQQEHYHHAIGRLLNK